MGERLLQIDAFTERPFRGNPAAVCLLESAREDVWMQQLAQEMNLSETAFVAGREDGAFALRWFTPLVEVDLCGHATLASAFALWHEEILARDQPAVFHTRSGQLTAHDRDGWIELDFPLQAESRTSPPEGLVEALGVMPSYVGFNGADYLVELASEEEVSGCRPDFPGLREVECRGVMITSRAAGHDIDFVSRFFAPAVGIDEDPVTGSAHCCLAPFWARRLKRDELVGFQASSRGGTVRVRVEGERVKLAGQAALVLRGELSV